MTEKIVTDQPRLSYELGKLRQAPNLDRRKDWAQSIFNEGIKRVKLDNWAKELGLAISYLGYEENAHGQDGKIIGCLMKNKEQIYLVEVMVDKEAIYINGKFYANYDREVTIGRVFNELIDIEINKYLNESETKGNVQADKTLISQNSKESWQERDQGIHVFEIMENGEVIAGAELSYLSKPVPLYQLSDLWVEYSHHGQGLGSRLMDQVEDFLRKRKKPGVLVEAILEDNPAKGMYQKRGWVKIPNMMHLFIFNQPKNLDWKVFQGYSMRYTPLTERPGFKSE